MSTDTNDEFEEGNTAPTRSVPPSFANAFGISQANNEVVIIDFVDADTTSDRIFSSVALTKSMARNFAQRLALVIERMDSKNDDEETDQ